MRIMALLQNKAAIAITALVLVLGFCLSLPIVGYVLFYVMVANYSAAKARDFELRTKNVDAKPFWIAPPGPRPGNKRTPLYQPFKEGAVPPW